jgi:hypothetical protein
MPKGTNGDKKESRVAVNVGPECGNVTAMQVEEVMANPRSSERKCLSCRKR